ncbi:MAG: 3'-5' exonuclease [Elioraea sp.]|nr:3'-5' exonuclease [Elioraea sp.]MDW8444695.1 3'-5' exonuclease [Acetobacteraceae bacterium]
MGSLTERVGRLVAVLGARLIAPNDEERSRRFTEPLRLPEGPLAGHRYVVFDLETTGLAPSRGDRIVAIGAVRVTGGRVDERDRFDSFCQPGRPIPPASTAIHGITDAMVAHAPPWPHVVAEFHAWARDDVLVAHNAAFDLCCLHAAEAQAGVRFDNPALCTMVLSRWLDPQERDHSLDAIAARHGIVVASRHDALGDAVATAHLFVDMLRRAEERGITSLEDLAAASRMRASIAAAAMAF